MNIPSFESAERLEMIKSNFYVTVWRGNDDWIYKRSSVEFIRNEFEMLEKMRDSGYVPIAQILDNDLLAIEDLGDQAKSWHSVTDKVAFMAHLPCVLDALLNAEIRHGDLTEKAIIVRGNKPILIDFAQSKLIDSPEKDKRPEGDRFWLSKSMDKICGMAI